MKLLLDHCVHKKAISLFAEHDVTCAIDWRWDRLSNGKLLSAAAAAGFDVFVTVDKKIRHEHNFKTLPLAIVELRPHFTAWEDLVAISAFFASALETTKEYRFVSIHSTGIEVIESSRRS